MYIRTCTCTQNRSSRWQAIVKSYLFNIILYDYMNVHMKGAHAYSQTLVHMHVHACTITCTCIYSHVHDSTCIHGTSAICGMCWGFVVSLPHIVQYCDVLTQVDYSHWSNGTHAVTTCGRIGLVNSSMCEPHPIHVPMDLWCYIHVKVSQYNTVHVLIKAPL